MMKMPFLKVKSFNFGVGHVMHLSLTHPEVHWRDP